jgi:formylmethanofuran dehydrogenase subunit A
VARPAYDKSIEKPLKEYFERYHTMRMENFAVSDDEIENSGRGALIVEPGRQRA